jgi:hypothetical protein
VERGIVLGMKRRVLIVLAVVVLAAVYFSGSVDHALYNVGLNFHECAHNRSGATLCGSELDEYRARVERTKRRTEAAQEKLSELSEEAASGSRP